MEDLHYTNDFLPLPEKEGIAHNITTSLHQIHDALTHLESFFINEKNHEDIPNKVIGRCIRLIKLHHAMKYPFEVSLSLPPFSYLLISPFCSIFLPFSSSKLVLTPCAAWLIESIT